MARKPANPVKPVAEPAKAVKTTSAPAKAPATSAPAKAPAVSKAITVNEAEIRLRAYEKWVSAGKPEGDGVNFWIKAEQELRSAQ